MLAIIKENLFLFGYIIGVFMGAICMLPGYKISKAESKMWRSFCIDWRKIAEENAPKLNELEEKILCSKEPEDLK